jgi:hypothetical protein
MEKHRTLLTAFLMMALGAHGQNSDQGNVQSDVYAYSGHITRADNGKPLAGATVMLMLCGTGIELKPGPHPLQTTAADGSYHFANVPSNAAYIRAFDDGFLPSGGYGTCGQSPRDIKLRPTARPTQMPDDALTKAYGDQRIYVDFQYVSLNADGTVLHFVSRNGHLGREAKGWAYDFGTKTLLPGPMPVFASAASPHDGENGWSYDPSVPGVPGDVIGQYKIDEYKSCRGCADTLTAASTTQSSPFVITKNLVNAYVGASDGSAIFWGDAWTNAKDFDDSPGFLLGIYNFKTHHRRFLRLSDAAEGLEAARPDGDGYLVVYSSSGSCLPDRAERIAMFEAVPNGGGRRPFHLCFVHVRGPSR